MAEENSTTLRDDQQRGNRNNDTGKEQQPHYTGSWQRRDHQQRHGGGNEPRSRKSFAEQRREEKRGKPFKKRLPTGNRERSEIQQLKQLYETFDFSNWETFREAPLSVRTKAGLDRCGFTKPTRIQKDTLALALQGRDILGAAKTGSGKTLAFLIPVLELLFREMWTRIDGLGALIITPTRELAYQIFEVLKKVGARHDFSGGLIIGGTEVGFERKRLHGTNIMICTPGRLLQHMDQNPLLDPTNLKILVLDEADRILDMGFERDLNAILENLPAQRQTLLFSATQTKSVKDLARLSLTNPCYVSVHEQAMQTTPDRLHQDYLVCELQDKLSLLWSFLKNHKSKKIIVFLSCCKQVQFINTVLRRLRPGTTVLHLHGNMAQPRRLAIYDEFCSKQSAILLATDLVARGLDFPKVDWVLQMDCPEDTDTYIHRVGRTARFENAGKALLILLPSEEEKMTSKLKERKVPINKIAVNPRRFYDIQRKVEAMCARDAELKASAQRCFVGYLKYVFVQKDKQVFQIEKLDLDLYARSLGLIVTPRARFLQKHLAAKGKQLKTKQTALVDDESSEAESNQGHDRVDLEKTHKQLSKKIEKFSFDTGIESDEEIFTKKGKPLLEDNEIGGSSAESAEENDAHDVLESIEGEAKAAKIITKVQAAKKVLKKKHIVPNKKVIYDDDGNVVDTEDAVLAKPLPGVEEKGGIDIELSKRLMREQDRIDKQIYREKIKSKHREERLRAKAERRAAATGGEVMLDLAPRGGADRDEAEEENSSEEELGRHNEASGQPGGDGDNDVASGEFSEAGTDDEMQAIDDLQSTAATASPRAAMGRGLGNRPRDIGDGEEFDDDDDNNSGDSSDRPGSGKAGSDESDDEGPLPERHIPKRPMKSTGKFGLKRRRVDGMEQLDTGLGLQGDEELALKLLQG